MTGGSGGGSVSGSDSWLTQRDLGDNKAFGVTLRCSEDLIAAAEERDQKLIGFYLPGIAQKPTGQVC